MRPAETLLDLLASQHKARGPAPAILAPGRDAISYAALHAGVNRAGDALALLGLGQGSRIAVALPDGVDAGLAMLAAMTWTTCAPLSPTLDHDAYTTSFAQLRIDALIAAEADDGAVVTAARAARLPIVRLCARPPHDVGFFALRAESAQTPVTRSPPTPDDVALVMRTSGTTGGAKVVPIAHRALIGSGSASSIGVDDRCICVSPLHTASGLWFALVVPLAAGASTVVASGFSSERFFEWLHAFRPTFFSASPTVHAAIADELLHTRKSLPNSLRFVRSSSNAMSAAQQAKLESLLGVPVIQGYGATEAGLISQDSPLPGERRIGSVGIPRQARVRILDADGAMQHAGVTGEIVVSGPGLMRGYENDPEANERAFHEGWFRTGDAGHLDADGYLFITGRLNEIINRGGLKVAPADVDAVLSRHPAVQDSATVGIAHPSLGHDVVTGVILRRGESITALELRDFALENLPPSKVPTTVVIVGEFPRNALGKVQRAGLADLLREKMRVEFVAPRDAEEALVAGIFAAVLGVPRAGALDNFFDLGGDSLLGMQVLARVSGESGIAMEPRTLFEAPTVAQFALRLRSGGDGSPKPPSDPPALLPRTHVRSMLEALPPIDANSTDG
ncbi:MAG: non-ribosomal peptide synthetase [Betaproteobacteria bacterium]